MDDALAPTDKLALAMDVIVVLILVVMDDALAHSPILRTAFVVRS